jgi:predicted Zn-ribbon and HTH transcriptional regulator
MAKITLHGYQCERCGHVWVPRTKIDDEPTICPKCKSPYWNKPRKLSVPVKDKVANDKVKGDRVSHE